MWHRRRKKLSDRRVQAEFEALARQLGDIPDPTVGPRDYTLAEPADEPYNPAASALRRPRGWAGVAGLAWIAVIVLPLGAYFGNVDVPGWASWLWLGGCCFAFFALLRSLKRSRENPGEDGARV